MTSRNVELTQFENYREGAAGRTLTTLITTIPAAQMTVAKCTAACQAGGFILAGVEYSGECCKFPSPDDFRLNVLSILTFAQTAATPSSTAARRQLMAATCSAMATLPSTAEEATG